MPRLRKPLGVFVARVALTPGPIGNVSLSRLLCPLNVRGGEVNSPYCATCDAINPICLREGFVNSAASWAYYAMFQAVQVALEAVSIASWERMEPL